MAESSTLAFLLRHQAHDVRALLQRWRKVVKGSGFRVQTLARKDGYPLVAVRNRSRAASPGFYVSAGIHGDEPAGPWGLLDWFERGGVERLGDRPVLLFPCLNPLGLRENRRVDGEGEDLNRIFDEVNRCPIREVREAIGGSRFQVAICLHEDYDALGAYVYDLSRTSDVASARSLLDRATTKRVPVDSRRRIDGRVASDGVIFRRRLDRRNIPGLPEAVFLFLDGHAERTLTFETPSEFSLPDRIAVQRRFLDAASRWCVRESS